MSGRWSARLSGNPKRTARRAVARTPPPTYSGGCGRVHVPVHTPAHESAPDQTDSIRSSRPSISVPRSLKSIPSEARINSPCVRGFPWGEAKLKRSTVSNTSGPAGLSGLGLHEGGEVGEQRAVDDLDAGAHGVDVVGEQRELRTGHPRYIGGHL